MEISRRRQHILSLCTRISTLTQIILARSPLFPGWLYEQKSRCGKPQCKCAKGRYRHRLWCVSFVEKGKSRTRVVPKGDHEAVRRMTEDYTRFREARRQIRDIFDKLLAAIDAVGEARCKQGRKRYLRLIVKRKAVSSSEDSKKGRGR